MTIKKTTAVRKKPPARGATATTLPMLAFATKAAWSTWLRENHGSSRGVWLKIAKKGSKSSSVPLQVSRSALDYAEALEAALAWGWIDGQKGAFDETWWLQKFTPRGKKSIWSKINREKAEALIAAKAMKAPGLAEIERARRDGRWEAAYASQSNAEVPADLAQALAANPRAAQFFETLSSSNRYAILFRVNGAKKPETRAERIARFVAMCAAHETIHPQSVKKAPPKRAGRAG
jgi:uncharacterized protein YdeI (YjbR/CyaY-like superfamily)